MCSCSCAGGAAAARAADEGRLAELQLDPSEKPEDMSQEAWERFQRSRNTKIEKEMEVCLLFV